jgi:hypothetical protein
VKLTNYSKKTSNRDSYYAKWIFNNPIIVSISISPKLWFYNSGIFTPGDNNPCPTTNRWIFVNIDGYEMDDQGNGHYLLKFPWGSLFGEYGNVRFAKKGSSTSYTKNTCGIYDTVYTVEYKI